MSPQLSYFLATCINVGILALFAAWLDWRVLQRHPQWRLPKKVTPS